MTVSPWRVAAVLVLASLLTGCTAGEEPATSDSPRTDLPRVVIDSTDVPEEDIVSLVGRVQYVNLEGGFYGIVADQTGDRYQPMNLPDEFQADGLRVQVRALRKDDVMTIQMWGQPIRVLSIQQIGVTPDE